MAKLWQRRTMAYGKRNYKVHKESETFTFIPQPEDYGVLDYLTSFGHEYLKRNYCLERKDFDFYMINYTVEGSGEVEYDGKILKLKKGCLCIIYLGEKSYYYPTSGNLEIYFFHVSGAQVKDFYKKITAGGNYVLENFPENVVKEKFEAMKKQLTGDVSYFELSKICNALLTDILEFSVKNTSAYPPFIFNIFLAIRDGENATVKDVAKAVGFDPIYLERVFKKHTGETIKHALESRDLNRAENMLLTTDQSVAEIAEAVGYSNSNGLIRLFKKYTGTTPLGFRKKNRPT